MSGSYFREIRNAERSIFDFLKTRINNSWSNVNVILGFTEAYDYDLPVVAIRLLTTESSRLEIGNINFTNTYSIVVDIFATSVPQQLDLADFILNQIKEPIPYQVYSRASDGTNVVGTASGNMQTIAVTDNRKVEIIGTQDAKDKYRHLISFLVKKF